MRLPVAVIVLDAVKVAECVGVVVLVNVTVGVAERELVTLPVAVFEPDAVYVGVRVAVGVNVGVNDGEMVLEPESVTVVVTVEVRLPEVDAVCVGEKLVVSEEVGDSETDRDREADALNDEETVDEKEPVTDLDCAEQGYRENEDQVNNTFPHITTYQTRQGETYLRASRGGCNTGRQGFASGGGGRAGRQRGSRSLCDGNSRCD